MAVHAKSGKEECVVGIGNTGRKKGPGYLVKWDKTSGKVLKKVKIDNAFCLKMELNRGRNVVAVATVAGSVCLYDVETLSLIRKRNECYE